MFIAKQRYRGSHVCSFYMFLEVAETLEYSDKASHFPVSTAVTRYKPTGLYAECHDGIDNVVVVLLEGLDGLLP